ncbi:unnamed protein product [Urochloa humidicola]
MVAAAHRIPGAPAAEQSVPPDTVVESVPSLAPLMAAAHPVFPDEILEEIFLRLDDAADLARASAACSSFLRIVSESRFRRRFRSLHPSPVLGILSSIGFDPADWSVTVDRFVPAEPPYSSAPAARALTRAADFTFSFLPDSISWWIRDCRNGRVLLIHDADDEIASDDDEIASDGLVVCDPLHRRYVMIPPIFDDLMDPIPQDAIEDLKLILAPAGKDEDGKLNDEEESSFRVICAVQCGNNLMAFFFSSVNREWELVTYHSSSHFLQCRHWYAHGCLFWVLDSERKVLMLDTRGMKFSIIDLPPKNDALRHVAIVEAGEGRLGLLTLGDSTINLSCKIICRNNGVGTEGWQHYKIIPLPKEDSNGFNYHWFIMDAEGRYVSLMASTPLPRCNRPEYFVLDLKTMLVERLCVPNHIVVAPHFYASFPPPLPPSL